MTEAIIESPGRSALGASAVALVVAVGCIATFLPPLVERTTATPLRAAATGAVLACAMLLHWVFLGIGARRLRRSVAGWLALAVLLFPIGSAMALILLGWFDGEASARRPAVHRV